MSAAILCDQFNVNASHPGPHPEAAIRADYNVVTDNTDNDYVATSQDYCRDCFRVYLQYLRTGGLHSGDKVTIRRIEK